LVGVGLVAGVVEGGGTFDVICGCADVPAVDGVIVEPVPAVAPVPAPDWAVPSDALSLPQPIKTLARHNALTLGFITSLRSNHRYAVLSNLARILAQKTHRSSGKSEFPSTTHWRSSSATSAADIDYRRGIKVWRAKVA
jgi:hypothetical protein